METLILRAANALSIGVSPQEVTRVLVQSGTSPEDAFLAVCAAKILRG